VDAAERAADALVGKGQREHYASTDNLEKRQALFAYRDPSRSIGAPPFERIEWGGVERVLDAGCGNGPWTRVLRRRFGLGSVVGLDLSMGMLAAAGDATDGRLINADVQALPLGGRTFDVVLALWMLYHVADRSSALQEFRRVLRPGGCLLATTNSASPRRSDEVLAEALAEVTGRPPSTDWQPDLGFTAENGAELLSTVFDRVESHRVVGALAVPEPGPVLAAMGTLHGVVEATLGVPLDWGAVEAAARRRLERTIAEEGCFADEFVSVWFVAWS
jgi:SAM-dependent methyltransferase